MKIRFFSDKDEWTTDGENIEATSLLDKLRAVVENESPIIVEHRFYRGSSAPNRFISDDFDDFIGYLNEKASAGDAFYVWHFGKICTDGNILMKGKCPDDEGGIPRTGAY